YEADKDVPIILGRPFLATGRSLIDVQQGELTMKVHDQKVKFNMFDAMKYPNDFEDCSCIQVLDEFVEDHFEKELMEYHTQKFGEIQIEDLEIGGLEHEHKFVGEISSFERNFESLEPIDKKSKPIEPYNSLTLLQQPEIRKSFIDERLFTVAHIKAVKTPWYDDFSNYLDFGNLPPGLSKEQMKEFFHEVKFYLSNDASMVRQCVDDGCESKVNLISV
ncbi:hypothetical protein NP118_23480, partial [Salmonella enterica]|nr:hypothetical protein [Salmonella enterica]